MKIQWKAGARAPGWIPLVALIVAAGGLVAPPQARAQGVNTALMPFEQSVATGAEFDVELDVTEAGSLFNGFDVVVSFDPAALTLMPLSPISLQQGCLMTGACSAACGNTFHRFATAADSAAITDILLCNQIALTGPGALYKLHFKASSTPQVTFVRMRRAKFYHAGVYVNPVTTADCAIGIGVTLNAGAPAGPRGLKLRAAPNPAAGAVMLTVEAEAGGEQRVAVYDVSGRLVRELSSGWYAGGVRAVPWDGRDSLGARAPAGVYLVSLRAGSRVVRTHVTLLK